MRLDKERLVDKRLGGNKGRVETLHMTHLHLDAGLIGQFFQGVGFVGRGHNGFLNEDMLALLQGLGGTFEMTDGGGDDVDHVHGINQGIDGVEALHIHLGFHLSRRLHGGVVKPN